MAEKFSRFLNLERTRAQGPSGRSSSGNSGRFDALQGPAAPPSPDEPPAPGSPEPVELAIPAAPVTPGQVAAEAARAGRFGPESPTLELEERRPEDQPFVRCASCQADNSPFAQTCQFCGSDFNTVAQRSFNERLWSQRRQEAAVEAETLARIQEERARASATFAENQRQAVGLMAMQVAQQTRSRLDREEFTDALGSGRQRSWVPGSLAGIVPQNLKAVFILVALAVYLVLLIVPSTRRFVLLGSLAAVGLYVRVVWGGRRRW